MHFNRLFLNLRLNAQGECRFHWDNALCRDRSEDSQPHFHDLAKLNSDLEISVQVLDKITIERWFLDIQVVRNLV